MTPVPRELLNRAKQEYLEMPGLALTMLQAQRLWNLDVGLCEALLSTLVREAFLSQTRGAAFVRCSDTRTQVRWTAPEA